jgi:hypothetical protein
LRIKQSPFSHRDNATTESEGVCARRGLALNGGYVVPQRLEQEVFHQDPFVAGQVSAVIQNLKAPDLDAPRRKVRAGLEQIVGVVHVGYQGKVRM